MSCCNENIQYGCFNKLRWGIKRKLKFNGANNCIPPSYLTVCFTNSWNEFIFMKRIKKPRAKSSDVTIVYIKSWPYNVRNDWPDSKLTFDWVQKIFWNIYMKITFTPTGTWTWVAELRVPSTNHYTRETIDLFVLFIEIWYCWDTVEPKQMKKTYFNK